MKYYYLIPSYLHFIHRSSSDKLMNYYEVLKMILKKNNKENIQQTVTKFNKKGKENCN